MKKLTLWAVLGLVLVPSLVSAAWWNPTTWLQKAPVSPPAPIIVPIAQPTPVPVAKPALKAVPKAMPKKKTSKTASVVAPTVPATQTPADPAAVKQLQNIFNKEDQESATIQQMQQQEAQKEQQAAQEQQQVQQQESNSIQQFKQNTPYYNSVCQNLEQQMMAVSNTSDPSLNASVIAGEESKAGCFASVPAQMPTAICNDGTDSYSQNNSGTCSYHGGVSEWFNH